MLHYVAEETRRVRELARMLWHSGGLYVDDNGFRDIRRTWSEVRLLYRVTCQSMEASMAVLTTKHLFTPFASNLIVNSVNM